MKKLLATALFAVCVSALIAAPAKQFGVGVRLGAPVGFDAKYWLNGVNALDFALGWATPYYGSGAYGYNDSRCYDAAFYDNNRGYCNGIRGYYGNGYYGYGDGFFHLHADYLWHNFNVIHAGFPIPLYYGLGAQYEYLGYSQSLFGIRGTFGIDFMPTQIPFDFFAELSPVFAFLPGPGFDMFGGIGARFWF